MSSLVTQIHGFSAPSARYEMIVYKLLHALQIKQQVYTLF